MVELSGEVADTVPPGASVSVRINVADNISCGRHALVAPETCPPAQYTYGYREPTERKSGGFGSGGQTVRGRAVRRALHRARLVDQFVLDEVTNELSGGVHVQFLEDARLVRADGLVAQREHLGDLANGFSRAYQAHHFELTIGQRVMRRAIRVLFEIHRETFGQRETDVSSSGDHFRDRARELRARAVLRDVTGGARLIGAARVLLF